MLTNFRLLVLEPTAISLCRRNHAVVGSYFSSKFCDIVGAGAGCPQYLLWSAVDYQAGGGGGHGRLVIGEELMSESYRICPLWCSDLR